MASSIINKLLENHTLDENNLENITNNRYNAKTSLDAMVNGIIAKINILERDLEGTKSQLQDAYEINENNERTIEDYSAEIAKKQKLIESIVKELDELRRENKDSNSELIDKLEATVAKLENSEVLLTEARAQKAAQDKMLEEHNGIIAELENRNNTLQNEIDVLSNDKVSNAAKIAQLKQELEDNKNELNAYKELAQEHDQMRQNTIDLLHKRIDEIESDFAQLELNNEELLQKLKDSAETIIELNAEIEKEKIARQRLAKGMELINNNTLNAQTENMAKIVELTAENAARLAEIDELRAANGEFAARIEQLLQEKEECDKKLRELESNDENMNGTMVLSQQVTANLKKELAEEQQKYNALKALFDEKEIAQQKQIGELQDEIAKIAQEKVNIENLQKLSDENKQELINGLNLAIAELKIRIAELEANATNKDELVAMQEKIDKIENACAAEKQLLVQKIAELESLLEENNSSNRQELENVRQNLNNSIAKLEEKNRELDGRIQELSQQKMQLEGQLAAQDANVQGLNAQINTLDAEIKRLNIEKAANDAKIKSLENSVNDLTNANSAISGLQNEITRLKAELAGVNLANNSLEATIAQQTNKLIESEEKIKGLMSRIAVLEQEYTVANKQIVDQLKSEVSTEQAKFAKLEADHKILVAGLEKNNAQLAEKIRDLELQNNVSGSEIETLRQKLQQNEELLVEANKTIAQLREELAELQKNSAITIEEKDLQIKAIEKEKMNLNEKIAMLTTQIDAIEKEKNNCNENAKLAAEEKNNLQRELADLQNNLARVSKENAEEIKRLQDEHARTFKGNTEEIKGLQSDLARVSKENAEETKRLQDEIANKIAQIGELQNEIAALRTQKGTSENQCESLHAIKAKLEQQLAKANQDLEEVRREKNELEEIINSLVSVTGAENKSKLKEKFLEIRDSLVDKVNDLINSVKNITNAKKPEALNSLEQSVNMYKNDVIKSILNKIIQRTNEYMAKNCKANEPCNIDGINALEIQLDNKFIDAINNLPFPTNSADFEDFKNQLTIIAADDNASVAIAENIIDGIKSRKIADVQNAELEKTINYYNNANQQFQDEIARIERESAAAAELARQKRAELEKQREQIAKENQEKAKRQKDLLEEIEKKKAELENAVNSVTEKTRAKKKDLENKHKECIAEEYSLDRAAVDCENEKKQKSKFVYKETLDVKGKKYEIDITLGVSKSKICKDNQESYKQSLLRVQDYDQFIDNAEKFKHETEILRNKTFSDNFNKSEIDKCIKQLVDIYSSQDQILKMFKMLYENTIYKNGETFAKNKHCNHIKDSTIYDEYSKIYSSYCLIGDKDKCDMLTGDAKRIAEIANEYTCNDDKVKNFIETIQKRNLLIKNLVYSALGSIRVIFKIRGPERQTEKAIQIDGENKYIRINYNGLHKDKDGNTYTNDEKKKDTIGYVYDKAYTEGLGYNAENFQAIHGPEISNKNVYSKKENAVDTNIQELLGEFLQGVDVTAYAYGGSGAGKTYILIKGKKEETKIIDGKETVIPEDKGIINLFADDIIDAIKNDKEGKYKEFGISVLELVPYGNGEERTMRVLKYNNEEKVIGTEHKKVVNFGGKPKNFIGPYWKDLLSADNPTAYKLAFDERKRNEGDGGPATFTKLVLWKNNEDNKNSIEPDASISYGSGEITNNYNIVHERSYVIPEALEVRDLYNLCDDRYAEFNETGDYNAMRSPAKNSPQANKDVIKKLPAQNLTQANKSTMQPPAKNPLQANKGTIKKPSTQNSPQVNKGATKKPMYGGEVTTEEVTSTKVTATKVTSTEVTIEEITTTPFQDLYTAIDKKYKRKEFTIKTVTPKEEVNIEDSDVNTPKEKVNIIKTDVATLKENITNILNYTFHDDNRQTGRTPFNPVSSRSHAFVEFHIKMTDPNDPTKVISVKAMIADLAGIERQLGNSVEILNYISTLNVTAEVTRLYENYLRNNQLIMSPKIKNAIFGDADTGYYPELYIKLKGKKYKYINEETTTRDIKENIYNNLTGNKTLKYGHLHKYITSIVKSVNSKKIQDNDSIVNLISFIAAFAENDYNIENLEFQNGIFTKFSEIKTFEESGYNIRIENVKKIIDENVKKIIDGNKKRIAENVKKIIDENKKRIAENKELIAENTESKLPGSMMNLYITDHLNEDNKTTKKLKEIIALENTMYFTSFAIVWSLRYLINFVMIYNDNTKAIIEHRDYEGFYDYIEDNIKNNKKYTKFYENIEQQHLRRSNNKEYRAGSFPDSTGMYKYNSLTTNELYPNDNVQVDPNTEMEKAVMTLIAHINNNKIDLEKLLQMLKNSPDFGPEPRNRFINLLTPLKLYSPVVDYVIRNMPTAKPSDIPYAEFNSTIQDPKKTNIKNKIDELFNFYANFKYGYNAGVELIGYLRSKFFYNKRKKNTKIIMICMASASLKENGYDNALITIPTCKFAMQIADIGGNVNWADCGSATTITGGGVSLNEIIRSAAIDRAKMSGGMGPSSPADISASMYNDLLGGNDKVRVKKRIKKQPERAEVLTKHAKHKSTKSTESNGSTRSSSSEPDQPKHKKLSQKQQAIESAKKNKNVVDTRVDISLVLKPIVVEKKQKNNHNEMLKNPAEEMQDKLFKKPVKKVKVRVRKVKPETEEKPKKEKKIEEEFNAIVVSDSEDTE